jgi:zinc transport system permease protein
MIAWYQLIGALPWDWAQFEFMKNALLCVLLAAPLFALLGCLVVSNHMAFFSDAIGHAALTGIAIGAVLGLSDPTWATLAFGGLLSLGVVALRRFSASSTDTIVGLVMALAVAFGIVILSRGGGFAKYSRYLVGDVLTVTPQEIGRLAVVLVAVVLFYALFFNRILLTTLNHALARSRGVPVWTVEAVFALLVGLTVTLCIPWVGLLVINSLLILPAAASRNLAERMVGYVWGAVVINLVAGVGGLIGSFYWNTAAGATMVLFAFGLFFVTAVWSRCRRRH